MHPVTPVEQRRTPIELWFYQSSGSHWVYTFEMAVPTSLCQGNVWPRAAWEIRACSEMWTNFTQAAKKHSMASGNKQGVRVGGCPILEPQPNGLLRFSS